MARPKGSKNRIPGHFRTAIQEAGMSPLQFLLNVMADPEASDSMRLDAAKAAAPFCHPRLSSVLITNMEEGERPTRAELEARLREHGLDPSAVWPTTH